MLFDQPIIGESQYGKYYLYAVRNGDGNEYSLFAPEEVHEKLKDLKQGDEAVVTKLAAQRGKKLVTTFEVKVIKKAASDASDNSKGSSVHNQKNPYLEAMLQSFADAIKVQEAFNGMANVNQLAVTIFISRIKANGL
jgi:hypothetical protein